MYLFKTEMHEWKNYYIFCFSAEIPQISTKDLITMQIGKGFIRYEIRCAIYISHLGQLRHESHRLWSSDDLQPRPASSIVKITSL